MKRRAAFTGCCLALGMIAICTHPAVAAGNDALGTWKDTETGALIRISPCGKGICAQLAKIPEPNARDIHNPDPALRSRRVEGIVIMSAVRGGAGNWRGMIYNRDDGQTYAGSLTLLNKNQIKLEGCVAALFCKSRIWVRLP